MSFLTAASERSSSGLSGASGVPSPPFSVLSESLAALFCAFAAPALSGGALVALVSVSSSVVTGLVSVFASLGWVFGSTVGVALFSVLVFAAGTLASGLVSSFVLAADFDSAFAAGFVSTLGDAFADGFVAVLAATFGSLFGAALTGALAAGFTGDAFAFGFSAAFGGAAFAFGLAATFAAGLTAAFGAALGMAFATGFTGDLAFGLPDTFAAGFGAAFGFAAAGFDVLLEAAFEGTLVAIWLDAPGPACGPSTVQILAGKCDAQGG